jgi:hypothetical protein
MKLKRTMDIVGFQGCDNGRCNETRMIRMIKCGFSLFSLCLFNASSFYILFFFDLILNRFYDKTMTLLA